MRSSFPKHVNRHTPQKRISNVNTKFVDYSFGKELSAYYICAHMYMFMNISFPKHHLQTWHLHCKHRFFDWRLTRFRKELFICYV